jgi:predicted acyltransferase
MLDKLKNRIQSLDIFRGITIAFMIIVNTPGDGDISFGILKHAHWNGFTPTDLVFPSFVFITGLSSWFSFKRYNHTLSQDLLLKIWKRTLIIFLLGVAMYAFPFYNNPPSNWRILGVLQRIALCYGIGSTLSLLLNRRQIIGLSAALLLCYWWIMSQFGDLTLAGNAGQKLDLWLFGESHLYHGEGVAFDPEGLLSTMPSIVTFLIGYLAGQYLGQNNNKQLIFKNLLMWGAILIVGGIIWNFEFPINKKLWTSSYVLLAGGLSMSIFAVCYYVVDILGMQKWGKPFIVFGTNAILAYLVSELLVTILNIYIQVQGPEKVMGGYEAGYTYLFTSWMGRTEISSLLYALFYTSICWLIVYIFYRKNIFLKVG